MAGYSCLAFPSSVRTALSLVPNWRDPAPYAPLLIADRSLIAWEWLRRDPVYRSAAAVNGGTYVPSVAAPAQSFGLVAFEPPALAVPDARPLWTARLDPYVLDARPVECAEASDRYDLARLGFLTRFVQSDGRDHLLLCDGFHTIRLDAPAATLGNGPTGLRFLIEGIASAETKLLALRRLVALVQRGRFSRTLHRPEIRAKRWILLLRTADALAERASQREIAEILLGRETHRPRWRTNEPSLRSQAQRLVRSARRLGAGDYRRLLR